MKRFWKSTIVVLVCNLMLAAAVFGGGTSAMASNGEEAPAQEEELDPNTPVSDDGTVGKAKKGMERPSDVLEMVSKGSYGSESAKEKKNEEGDVTIDSVIGSDGRTQVTSTTTWPYRAIVHVTSSIGGCTGWMISSRTVATAGHCIHNGSWATNVKVYPGRNGSSLPYGSCNGVSLKSVTGWTVNRNTNYDYGAIQLDCSVGNTTGYFGFRYTSSSLNGTAETISGYPGDKTYGTQWKHSDQIRNTYTYKLEYQNDTYGGQSGSPVYHSYSGCSSACSIAIHTNGGSTYNRGTRITSAVYNNLNSWK